MIGTICDWNHVSKASISSPFRDSLFFLSLSFFDFGMLLIIKAA